MPFFISHRKEISWTALVAFLGLICFCSSPARAENSAALGKETGSTAELRGTAEGVGAIEVSQVGQTKAAKKRFPWLLVAGGALVLGVAAYLLLGVKKAEEGFEETFDAGVSSKWTPRTPAAWSVADGIMACSINVTKSVDFECSLYDYAMPSEPFVVEVRMRRTAGSPQVGNAIGLITPESTLSSISGYLFQYKADGAYWISIFNNANMNIWEASSADTPFSALNSDAITRGLGQWNTIRIVRSGASYRFVINGQLVYTFTNSKYDVRKVGLFFAGWITSNPTKMEYDYVKAKTGETLESANAPSPFGWLAGR